MSAENKITLAIDVMLAGRMRAEAQRRGISVSRLVREWAEKYLPQSDADTVVLRVPRKLRADKLALRDWVTRRAERVIEALLTDERQ